MSTKSNGVKSSLPSELYDNPALYGLRRSTRAHNPPERFQIDDEPSRRSSRTKTALEDHEFSADDEEDSDVVSSSLRRKKKRKSKPTLSSKSKNGSSSKRSNESLGDFFNDPYDNNIFKKKDSDVEDDNDDEEFFQSQREEASIRAKKKQKLSTSGTSTPQYTQTRFSSRNNKVVNYNFDDDNDDADLMDSEDEAYANSHAVQDYIVEDPTGKLKKWFDCLLMYLTFIFFFFFIE